MPMYGPSAFGDFVANVVPSGRTQYDKLKGLEGEMQRQSELPPYKRGWPEDWLQGMDLLRAYPRLLLPPADPGMPSIGPQPLLDPDVRARGSFRDYGTWGQLAGLFR